MSQDSTVFVVEDDNELRQSLQWMLQTNGFQTEVFGSPAELLETYDPSRPGCFVVDLCLPGLNGLELLDELAALGGQHPFVMITGHGTVSSAVDAMKRDGAVDFISKPFDHKIFLERVKHAVDKDATDRLQRQQAAEVEERIQSLTRREREVLEYVVDGKLTKQIASELGISTKTVEVHRSHITRKMKVQSVAQLVRMVALRRVMDEEDAA